MANIAGGGSVHSALDLRVVRLRGGRLLLWNSGSICTSPIDVNNVNCDLPPAGGGPGLKETIY